MMTVVYSSMRHLINICLYIIYQQVIINSPRRKKHGGNGDNCPRTLATTGAVPPVQNIVVMITAVNN